jgi:hypothetical protein
LFFVVITLLLCFCEINSWYPDHFVIIVVSSSIHICSQHPCAAPTPAI